MAKKKKIARAKKPKPIPVKAPPMREALPHSFLLRDWEKVAPHVAPNTLARAKHLVRSHRDELVSAGALTRIGRELYINAGPFVAWMFSAANKKQVADFQPPMNQTEK